jgi:hypothetical protein
MTSCSLTPSEQRERLLDWAELVEHAEDVVFGRDTVTVRFAPDPKLAGTAAELAGFEMGCCSFLKFRLEIDRQAVTLVASAPPMFAQTLKRMFSTSPSSTT